MSKLKALDKIALTLLIIGGIDWGLVGSLKFDPVAWLFSGMATPLARAVYALVGLAALYFLFAARKLGRR